MPKKHRIRSGECLSSVAALYGFFPETLWELPENSELKELRGDPNVLLEGVDEVFIPDKRQKEVSADTETTHQFRRKGVPEMFRLQVMDGEGSPVTHADYRLLIDGHLVKGTTNGEGNIEPEPIPPKARKAILILQMDGQEVRMEFALGTMSPISETKGVQERLKSLGYFNGATDGELTPEFTAALSAFQLAQSLEESGEADEATRQKLEEVFEG